MKKGSNQRSSQKGLVPRSLYFILKQFNNHPVPWNNYIFPPFLLEPAKIYYLKSKNLRFKRSSTVQFIQWNALAELIRIKEKGHFEEFYHFERVLTFTVEIKSSVVNWNDYSEPTQTIGSSFGIKAEKRKLIESAIVLGPLPPPIIMGQDLQASYSVLMQQQHSCDEWPAEKQLPVMFDLSWKTSTFWLCFPFALHFRANREKFESDFLPFNTQRSRLLFVWMNSISRNW